MPTRVERDWNFNPDTRAISATREHPTKDRFGNSVLGHMLAFQIRIDDKTAFDENVWDAWWNKKPIAISYNEYTFGPDTQCPPTVVATKIERAPEGAKNGQII